MELKQNDIFLDCYIGSEPEGFPVTTYICQKEFSVRTKSVVGEYFYLVNIVDITEGQSPQELPASIRALLGI